MPDLPYLEQQKADLLTEVADWSETRLAHRCEGGWSTAEMFDHIVKVEVNILAAARKGLLTPRRIGVSDRLRNAFLTKIFESDRRVKVPASAEHVLPDSQPSFAGVVQKWGICRVDLAQFIEAFPASQLDRGIFLHPVGGWMNLAEVMKFFSVHMVHHQFQLDRLRISSGGL